MPSYEYRGKSPEIASDAWVAPTASLIGDVVVGAGASIWFNAVLRGDMAQIVVGRNSSIQDSAVVHTEDRGPTTIGPGCTIGHGATVHSSTLEEDVVVGAGAVLAGGNTVGREAWIRAGAVLPEGVVVPARAIMDGVPARQVGNIDPADRQRAHELVANDQRLASEHSSSQG
ncbi:MAG: gamma carbonic anhydrase family protein [Candidatus Limnocylindria bacterium]